MTEYQIDFDAKKHEYRINGKHVDSVTQLVSKITGLNYDTVPKSTLSKTAEYGNKVHEWVEHHLLDGEDLPQTKMMELSTSQVDRLMLNHHAISSEKIVHYKDYFAGTYDLLCELIFYDVVGHRRHSGLRDLVDIKTTAEFHEECLEWQLGMYKMAIEEEDPVPINDCYCLWLPKGKKAELIFVQPKSKVEVLEKLYEIALTDR